MEYYTQAIKLRPNDAQAHNDLGSAYHYMGKSAAASAVPQNEDARGLEATLKLVDSGIVKITVDEKNQAYKVVNDAVRLQCLAYISSEKSKYTVTTVTTVTIVKGKTKAAFLKAEAEYRKAIEIKSRYAPAYRNLGTLYYEMGRKKEAVDFWKTALKLEASDKGLKVYLQELGRPSK